MRIIHRLSLLLIFSLACLFMGPAWITSLGSCGYYWPYYSQAYAEQYGLDIQTPSGSISGIPGQSYSYSTSATDPDGNQVQYMFDWGDGSTSVIGPFDSDISVTASHSWSKSGTYPWNNFRIFRPADCDHKMIILPAFCGATSGSRYLTACKGAKSIPCASRLLQRLYSYSISGIPGPSLKQLDLEGS